MNNIRRCATKGCRKAAAPHKNFCHGCRKRKWREAQPISYLFDNLRTHARLRGKPFELTIEQFTAFCLDTRYHDLKGTDPDSLTIDRIRPELGYVAGNLRVLTHLKNSRRRHTPPTEADLGDAVEM